MGSRYLFIVLYVFLEHHLSRGDYRRAGFEARPQRGQLRSIRGRRAQPQDSDKVAEDARPYTLELRDHNRRPLLSTSDWVTEERAASVVLALSVLLSGFLTMWVGRDTTLYNVDEVAMYSMAGWDAETLLEPFLDKIILVTRVVFLVVFGLFVPLLRHPARGHRRCHRTRGPARFLCKAEDRPGRCARADAHPPLLRVGVGAHPVAIHGDLGRLRSRGRDRGAARPRQGEPGGKRDGLPAVVRFGRELLIGVAFAIGVAVLLVLRQRWNQAWIVLVPLGLTRSGGHGRRGR